jgi:hypothetical protein
MIDNRTVKTADHFRNAAWSTRFVTRRQTRADRNGAAGVVAEQLDAAVGPKP